MKEGGKGKGGGERGKRKEKRGERKEERGKRERGKREEREGRKTNIIEANKMNRDIIKLLRSRLRKDRIEKSEDSKIEVRVDFIFLDREMRLQKLINERNLRIRDRSRGSGSRKIRRGVLNSRFTRRKLQEGSSSSSMYNGVRSRSRGMINMEGRGSGRGRSRG